MGLTLPGIVVALPFASAALLACIASWSRQRAGHRTRAINGSSP